MERYYWEADNPFRQYFYESMFGMLSQGLISVSDQITEDMLIAVSESFVDTVRLCSRDAEMYTDQIDAMLFDIRESPDDWMFEDVIILWLLLLPFNGILLDA